MSLPFQCFLRLPGCIRRQAFLDAIPQRAPLRKVDTNAITRGRFFSNTANVFSRTKSARPSSHPSVAPPKPPSGSPPVASSKPKSYADALLDSGPETLIYKSPNHRSFAYLSWICGGMLMFGGYNWALLTSLEPPGDGTDSKPRKSWLVKSTATFVALFFTVLGTSVMLAPAKTIRTISAQAASKTGHTKAMLLYCEIEGFLPFQKNRTIMATRPESLLDRRVSAQDIEFSSVPLSAAQAFTADPKPFAEPLIKPTGGIISRAWNDLRINTRRMFYRDGFAYIRFKDYGSYKIDLQNCELLDNGRALEHLTTPDPDKGVGAIALFRRKFLV
ncbi:hypothetical protein D0869_09905 [Hortaea werneckii]|uniref:Uncharacterized protein n=1 Tax=Hortaea werneckii TaxID=91943 RepID=A0A3M6Y8D9_HORWE|nr:hypothetical protein D0869_09905 [Hortaea werneckii]RMX99252.1 hypothetical protein D0868_09642 [Hortaea werneckii]